MYFDIDSINARTPIFDRSSPNVRVRDRTESKLKRSIDKHKQLYTKQTSNLVTNARDRIRDVMGKKNDDKR
jgi:hypothetical protein